MLDRMRRDLVAAITARDEITVSALRCVLAAVDNAGAVSPRTSMNGPEATSPHVAGAASGLGATEVARRQLGAGEVVGIVRREVSERVDAANEAARLGATSHADRLLAEAGVLAEYLPEHEDNA